MERRRLGGTGIDVSRIGFGLAAVGRPGYINLGRDADLGDAASRTPEQLKARAHALLDAAYAGGVRYFDAARSYGLSEQFLADWLAARGDQVSGAAVGSKWGYAYTAGWRVDAEHHEIKAHTLERLEAQWAESRALLGDRINLYQIHSATLETGVLENDPVLDRLAEIRANGAAIGLSVSGPRQGETIERALRVERDGAPLFATVQASWNLLERAAGPALAAAHAAGRGVIIKEALANGRLTAHNHGDPALAALTSAPDPDAIALAAVLSQPWADCVLSGAATEAQLASNLKAQQIENAADWLERIAPEPPEAYWGKRAALTWS